MGYRCRRTGYTFEWNPHSDEPTLRSPEGKITRLVNICDVPYVLGEINYEDATPEYHRQVDALLAKKGCPAVTASLQLPGMPADAGLVEDEQA